jgi:putative phosphoserine phosphatase / 1-acylglycerol-3-phosphate O-acyltransferase
MKVYQRFTRHIQDKPGAIAFFDLDGTLIDTHSVKAVFAEQLRAGDIGASELLDLASMSVRYLLQQGNFEDALEESLANMAGSKVQDYMELGDKVFRERLFQTLFPEMKAVLRRHRELGHELVIITSATRFQVQPVADYLGIEQVLCTEMEENSGQYTGKLDGAPCYGDNKLKLARAVCRQRKISLAHCYFYSNGAEDLPLLEKVGYPVAVNADKKLTSRAEREDWIQLKPASRSSRGVADIARTVGTFASILPSLAVGLPFRLRGNKEESINFSMSTWGEIGALIAGLKLRVNGEDNLWAQRPAVFVFNHQSAMDTLIMAKLLRRDFTGIGKKEISRQPIMGPALKAVDAVLIDRDNINNPREAMQPAVEALQQGRSVIIAPEGTRSQDENLGTFKSGAFHLAQQAGVPVVPVVIHNALDSLPRNGGIIRPAEVEVTVLKPVATARWTARSVSANRRKIRQQFLETLGQADETG